MPHLEIYKFLIKIIYLLLLFTVLISCDTNTQNNCINEVSITDNYNSEVVNYLYETLFYGDEDGVLDKAYKWDEDIRIYLYGSLASSDSLYVNEAITEINTLNIPISLNLVSDSASSNLQLYFGNSDFIKKHIAHDDVQIFTGGGYYHVETDKIKSAKLGIINNAKELADLDSLEGLYYKKCMILEEMAQILGIRGDSFTYSSSSFFEGANNNDKLSEIDKDIIEFLYTDECLGTEIKREDFENRFSKIIYNNLNKGRLKDLLKDVNINEYEFKEISKMIYDPVGEQEIILKFPRVINLKLKGDYTNLDSVFSAQLVEDINKKAKFLKIILTVDESVWNRFPSINIHFENDTTRKGYVASKGKMNSAKRMIQYRINANITLSSFVDKNGVEGMNLHIAKALFRALGIKTNGEVFFVESTGDIMIKEKYMKAINFLYDPRFPSGISMAKFMNILDNKM